MLVAIVTIPARPASATTSASRACIFAFRTLWGTPCFLSFFARFSEDSIVIVPTTSDPLYVFDDIPGAAAYVDVSGKIRLRLIQTARLSQTPDGYTKRIDLVEVTVLE